MAITITKIGRSWWDNSLKRLFVVWDKDVCWLVDFNDIPYRRK